MVSRAGGYYGAPFKGYRVVTQGDPLSLMMFNVMVDVVVQPWLSIVLVEAMVPEGCGKVIQRMESFFYADDGIIISTQSDWLQWAFGILTCMFDWVVLWGVLVR